MIKINLSEKDKEKLKQIVNNLKQATDEMMEELSLTEEEFMKRIRKIRENIRNKEG